MVWKRRLKPATAGETSESIPSDSVSSAWTANTYRGGEVEHQPVPEARAGRGVRVVAGHGEALGLGREAMPAQLRGHVPAAHAEAVVYLVIAHLLVLGDVVALDGERWHLRHEVVGQRSPVGHESS